MRAPEREVYLGDAVYASFDGYQIWLRTGDGNDNRIALEPRVFAALLDYAQSLEAARRGQSVSGYSPGPWHVDARLIAASSDLLNACNGLLGLLQLIAGRDDASPELRDILASNHRVAEARAAIAKAEGRS